MSAVRSAFGPSTVATFVLVASTTGVAFGDPLADHRSFAYTVRELNANTLAPRRADETFCIQANAIVDAAIARGDVEALVIGGGLSRDGLCRLRDFAEAGRVLGVDGAHGMAERDAMAAGHPACLEHLIGVGFARGKEPGFGDRRALDGVRFVWRIDPASRNWSLREIVGIPDAGPSDSREQDVRSAVAWQADVLRAAAESLPAWPPEAGTAPIHELPLTFRKN